MRKALYALCAAAGALAAALPARADDDKCHLYRISTVDMGIDEVGRLTVPMTVGTQSLTMLIDTGGLFSMVNDSVVRSQGWSHHPIDAANITIFGGTRIDTYTTAHDIQFGGLKASHMDMLIMPDGRLPAGLGGVLAPDILRAYDDDFDFANGKFSLFSPDHCEAAVVYWTKAYAQIGMRIDDNGHIIVPVTLDGKEVKFAFDTGAGHSVLDWDTAKDLFGIDEHSPGVTALPAGTGKTVYKYAFQEMTFGGGDTGAVTVQHPVITLTPSDVSKMGRTMNILGINVLRQLHLYLAYKEHHMFVSAASAH
jgi:predicted aspartyl protease